MAGIGIDRRRFGGCLGATVATLCAVGGSTRFASQAAVAGQPTREAEGQAELRIIAYNILKCTGWPADRELARRAVARGQIASRIAQELALYDPHVVNFSESPDEKLTREIAEQLGMQHVRFPSGEDWPGTLLSKFDVLESQNAPLARGSRPKDLFTRHWGRAVLKLPSGRPLVVHSAHLYPGQDPAIRLREIAEMIAAMQSDLVSEKSLILMGDLNHTPEGPEYAKWREAGLVDTFAAVGARDAAATNPEGKTFAADMPRIRIDYVWCAGPLAKGILSSRSLWLAAFRTNPADEQSFALSDHVPQFAEFVFAERGH
jgi:endonuclease/exonuclease/phosphatase family metal-dependent hydrolase